MLDKTFRNLRIVYFCSITLLILAFIYDVLYTTKYVIASDNVTLDRWGIIITLGGIYGILKMLHPRLNDTIRANTQEAIRKYATKYYTRHFSLVLLCIINMSCLFITGMKNFTFLTIITIFAMFLCIPNKRNLEEETKHIDET